MPIQLAAFQRAYEVARAAGLEPALRHLANSAGALVVPEARLDLVRVGIAAYGIDPAPGIAAPAGVTLRPVMTLRSQLVNVKQIAAGRRRLVRLDLDGRPGDHGRAGAAGLRRRHSAARRQPGRGRLGRRAGADPGAGLHGPVRGRARPGAIRRAGRPRSILFGPGDQGEPTAADWAEWCGTIGYEIVTRIGPRVPRVYRHATERLE